MNDQVECWDFTPKIPCIKDVEMFGYTTEYSLDILPLQMTYFWNKMLKDVERRQQKIQTSVIFIHRHQDQR